jgi:hypothetical protein
MPCGILSRRSDTEQISWSKFSHLPCTVAGSTLRILDGYGLRGKWPARPTLAPCIRFLSIDSHVCSTLPSDLASRRYSKLSVTQMSSRYVRCAPNAVGARSRDHRTERSSVLGYASGPSSSGTTLPSSIHYWHGHAARRSALPRERFSRVLDMFSNLEVKVLYPT